MIKYPISMNYVADWGIKEAVRELIQNALDAGGMEIEYTDDSTFITNSGEFTRDQLLLGQSVKSAGAIGKYGEGMKLAMLVLARLDIPHSIYSNGVSYYGMIDSDNEFSEDTFTIEEAECLGPANQTVVEIDGDLREIINEVYNPMEVGFAPSGLYVSGLRVSDLEGYKYGYNMPLGSVELDRDRRTVDSTNVQDFAADLILAQKSYKEIANLLFDNRPDVNCIYSKTNSSQDKQIGIACAELVKGQQIGWSYSGGNYIKVGYHFYNYAVNHGGAQKTYSSTAQMLVDFLEKNRSKLRRDVRNELKQIINKL